MKIIAVGMNYAEHNKELDGTLVSVPENPVIFMKPDSALLKDGKPFFIPDWAEQFDYETELVVRINRLGKCIAPRFAHRYYDAFTVGIDFTARDLQRKFREKGYPWELCKGFDNSAFCGQWLKLRDLGIVRKGDGAAPSAKTIQDLHFEMQLNGETRQVGWTGNMLHTVDQIIAYASRFYLLKMGDLIFTGTPKGVGKVHEGDLITAQLEGRQVLECRVR